MPAAVVPPGDSSLIATLALSLVFGLIGGLVATRLRLPALLGYLLAGIAIGPFTPGFVADTGIISELAEIGVIMLMFGVGMHFSIRDLWRVRSIAVPGAIAQIVVATGLGAGVFYLWGWPLPAGLILGLALSVASTVVLLRMLETYNLLPTVEGQIAVGWLVVEDIVTVLALIILPLVVGALNNAPGGSGNTVDFLSVLGLALAKMAALVALMLLVGARVFSWLLKRVAATGSEELFTLAVITVSLGVAYGASEVFGVSFALAAFLGGVVIGESVLSRRAGDKLAPWQHVLSALFFVSAGMLFDPAVLVRNPLQVVAVLGIIVVGKSLAAAAIVRLLRYPRRTALTIAVSLAQTGEFSFILAGLGRSLGLLSAEGYNLILAGSLFSIVLNPFLFRLLMHRHPQPAEQMSLDT